MEATNPCGEVPLLPWESCNLGSINLARFVSDGEIDRDALARTIRLGIRFLDDVLEVNRYPLPEVREATLANRKVGLGVMGFADLLVELGVPYGSREAVETAGELMRTIHDQSLKASRELAEERGTFPNFEMSVHHGDSTPMRNATVNTIAPTGTISMIAGCSSGIEPLFSLVYLRNVLEGRSLQEVHPLLEKWLREEGLYSRELMARIARTGSIKEMDELPAEMRRVFDTAFDVEPRQHLRVQAAFQRHTDNSVSKTVNLPHDASVEDVRGIYLSAHELRCKGITVYRYGTRDDQVLTLDDDRGGGGAAAEAEYSGGCASGTCEF
jgi:ribonucleoside-diphosphate reductase alpha chain